MTDKQRDSINARARELYFLTDEELPERDAFIKGASFALSLIQDDRLFEASKAAMHGLLSDAVNLQAINEEAVAGGKTCGRMAAEAAVEIGRDLLAVLEEEGK